MSAMEWTIKIYKLPVYSNDMKLALPHGSIIDTVVASLTGVYLVTRQPYIPAQITMQKLPDIMETSIMTQWLIKTTKEGFFGIRGDGVKFVGAYERHNDIFFVYAQEIN